MRAAARSPVKQWMTPGVGFSLRSTSAHSAWASRTCTTSGLPTAVDERALPAEHRVLHVARRAVVVEVEPRLPHRVHLGSRARLLEEGEVRLGRPRRLVRMDSQRRREPVRMLPGDVERVPEVSRSVELADDDGVHHPGRCHPGKDGGNVRILPGLEVAMSVDQPHHFTGLPGGRSPGSTSRSDAPSLPGGEQHAAGLDAPERPRLEVRHHHHLRPTSCLGRVGLGDAGDDGARTSLAQVHGELEQLVAPWARAPRPAPCRPRSATLAKASMSISSAPPSFAAACAAGAGLAGADFPDAAARRGQLLGRDEQRSPAPPPAGGAAAPACRARGARSSSGYCALASSAKVSGGAPSWANSLSVTRGTTGARSAASRYATSAASDRSARAASGSVFTFAQGARAWRNWFADWEISTIALHRRAVLQLLEGLDAPRGTRASASSTSGLPGPSPAPARACFSSGPASSESVAVGEVADVVDQLAVHPQAELVEREVEVLRARPQVRRVEVAQVAGVERARGTVARVDQRAARTWTSSRR